MDHSSFRAPTPESEAFDAAALAEFVDQLDADVVRSTLVTAIAKSSDQEMELNQLRTVVTVLLLRAEGHQVVIPAEEITDAPSVILELSLHQLTNAVRAKVIPATEALMVETDR